MNIVCIDAQGGGIGRQIISALKTNFPDIYITAVGTNSVAASAMLKAGANQAASGENAVTVCAKNADVIVGPIGIAIADSMLGEITPQMALAIGQSNAKKILIPINHCNNVVVGVSDLKISSLIKEVVTEVGRIIK